MNRTCIALAICLAAATAGRSQPPQLRAVPYWASLAAGEARMRTGPGRQFPATWLYRRAGLPLRVVQVVPGWRRVRDQDGTVGWMLATLLTDRRTAVVTGGTRDILADPAPGAAVRWRAEAGVVARIVRCAGGWCEIAIGGRRGHLRDGEMWGVAPGETVED